MNTENAMVSPFVVYGFAPLESISVHRDGVGHIYIYTLSMSVCRLFKGTH